MTTYTLPAALRAVSRFEMRVVPNQRSFANPFSPSAEQVVDIGGDYWEATLTIVPGTNPQTGAAAEAFIDRLRGKSNTIALYHLRRPVPLGTLRDGLTASVVNGALAAVSVVNGSLAAVTVVYGAPANTAAIAQYATTATVQTVAGRTLLAGDQVSIGGQTVRVLADATADGSGLLSIEFAPSARSAIPAYSAVVWNQPTVNFRLRGGQPSPVVWSPGIYEITPLDLVEAS